MVEVPEAESESVILQDRERLDNWMRPVWSGKTLYRETFAMISEDGSCSAPFLFQPKQILKAESYDGRITYEEGRDFTVKNGQIILTSDSRICSTDMDTFLYRTEQEAKDALVKGPDPGFGTVATTDGRFVNLSAVRHPEWMTKRQIAVTYTTEEKWKGFVPEKMLVKLPRLQEKLLKKEAVRIVLYGDSISCGFDCSGMYGQLPGQPVWPELLKHCMEEKWNSPIEFWNTSQGGMNTGWAIKNAGERVGKYQPDLVILGFGMNDRCGMEEYREKTGQLLAEIRRECPRTEFILIATTLPNPAVKTAPMYFCAHQEEYEESLMPLCGQGVILANVQAVHKEIMKRKRYFDLTGNLLNHPNDYLARIQAQVLAATLGL